MSNKLLIESIELFLNKDTKLAEAKLRQHMLETAAEINRQMEEDFVADVVHQDDEQMEPMNQNPETDFQDDIQYPLGDETQVDGQEPAVVTPSDEATADVVEQDVDGWKDVAGLVDELSELLNAQIAQAEGSDEQDVDGQEQTEPVEKDHEEQTDVEIKDDEHKVEEGFKGTKPVSDTLQEPVKEKSPVAPNATSPVQGAKPVQMKANPTAPVNASAEVRDPTDTISKTNDIAKPVSPTIGKDKVNPSSVLPK